MEKNDSHQTRSFGHGATRLPDYQIILLSRAAINRKDELLSGRIGHEESETENGRVAE